jgi:hypothetical protein
MEKLKTVKCIANTTIRKTNNKAVTNVNVVNTENDNLNSLAKPASRNIKLTQIMY